MSWKRVVIAVTKIFDRGKSIIPAEVRRRLAVDDGDKFVWLEDPSGRIYIEASKQRGRFRVEEGLA